MGSPTLQCTLITSFPSMDDVAQLYEEVCDAEGCNDIGCSHARDASAPATIMLLPPQFSVLNESRLPELVTHSTLLHFIQEDFVIWRRLILM